MPGWSSADPVVRFMIIAGKHGKRCSGTGKYGGSVTEASKEGQHPIYPVSSCENNDAPYGSYNHVKSEVGWQRS